MTITTMNKMNKQFKNNYSLLGCLELIKKEFFRLVKKFESCVKAKF